MARTASFVTGVHYQQSSPDTVTLAQFLRTAEGREWLDTPKGLQFLATLPDPVRAALLPIAPPPDQVAALKARRQPHTRDARPFFHAQSRPLAEE